MIVTRKAKTGVRYDVRLRDPSGRTYNKTFRTKREAENYAAQQRVDKARGQWVDPRLSSTRFGVWAAEWLRSDPGKSPSALARDESILRVHILPTLNDRTLSSVTPRDVQKLVTSWATQAKPRTVRRQYDTLRAILTAALDADLIGRSPCRGINLPTFSPEDRPIVDSAALLALSDAIGPDTGVMVYLGAVLGLRWGECAGLRVGRVDFLGGTLSVAEQRTRGKGGTMVMRQPKSAAGRRTMAVPVPLMQLLAQHLASRGLTGATPEALVFTTADGDGLDYSHWRQRVWLPAVQRAGLTGLHFHDLRRAAATAMVSAGVDPKTAQARLGHSDPRLTLAIYAQATSTADRAAADRLGAEFMCPRPRESGVAPREQPISSSRG